jgi:hypothetical protein
VTLHWIIGVRSTLIPNQRVERLRGAERFLVPQYEEAPLSLSALWLAKLMLIWPQLFEIATRESI